MSLCVIVGVGGGIGAAVARRFAADGFEIGLVARDRGSLERTAQALGPRTSIAVADASHPTALHEAIAELARPHGGVDVLVYNAALGTPGAAADLTPVELDAALAVDVVGAVTATQAVLPAMRVRGAGTILFTGGGLALYPAAAFAGLSVGKAALRAYALALQDDLAEEGIHAATVTVAGIVAPATPFDPDLIAAVYAELHRQPPGGREAERVITGLS